MKKLLTITSLCLITLLVLNFDLLKKDNSKSSDTVKYLDFSERIDNQLALNNQSILFWEKKLEENPRNYTARVKLSGLLNQRYDLEGEVKNLKQAYKYLQESLNMAVQGKEDIRLALIPVAIKLHRFQEAATYASHLKKEVDATYLTRFDAYMEIGQYGAAEMALLKVKEKTGFHYLVRKSKWQDHIGKLDAGVFSMERAIKCFASDQQTHKNKLWALSNTADMYGHQGKVNLSHSSHLTVLDRDPLYFHSLKSIAWIHYSEKKDFATAIAILNSLFQQTEEPGLLLDMREIYSAMGHSLKHQEIQKLFLEKMKEGAYAEMYALPYSELLIEIGNYDTGDRILEKEIKKRPTPEVYSQKAWNTYLQGDAKQAKVILEKHVINKTHEPVTHWHAAQIYKALNENKKAGKHQQEVLDAAFELGPAALKSLF